MTTLFRPLTRRPTATTVTVRDLLQKVQGGEVRIPRFQRPLRWSAEDVVQLLDSIWRGYPVGSLLFWKRRADAETITVGGATLSASETPDAWWVVDGQQRTTALAATMLELDHAGDKRWVVRFDPEHGEFLPGPPTPDRVGLDVPLTVLGDLKRLGRWIREYTPADEVIATVEEVQQRLLDYAIPAYIVDTTDEQALRGVFARLNSTGARMRADEVFQALLGAPSAVASTSLDLDVLQQGCDLDGFGIPARAEILKAVLAMSGLDPSRRLDDIGTLNELDLVSRDEAAEALSRTIGFLVEECQIPHVSLIPYPVVFFILARWFHVHPHSHPATLKSLARWVWRGAVTGAHQRAAVSQMREQVRDIVSGEEQRSLDRLLARVSSPSTGQWALKSFNLKSAHSRLETLALLAQGPRDRFGPVRLMELVNGGRIAREVWKVNSGSHALARTAANRVLLGTGHTGLSSELSRWSWTKDRQALESHLIDEGSFELLCQQDETGFLARREAAVVGAVQKLILQRAAWDQPLLRPLECYYEEPIQQ
jgi:hypothetical protein